MKRLDKSSNNSSKDTIKYMKVSTSNNNLLSSSSAQFSISNNNNLNCLDSISTNNNNNNMNNKNDNINARQLDRNKSIDSMIACNTKNDNNTNNKTKIRRNSSLMSFKSLDISLKSIYSSFKGHHSNTNTNTKTSSNTYNEKLNKTSLINDNIDSSNTSITKTMTPHLRVESVDQNELQVLLTYPQSPGGSQQHQRRSFDRTSSQYLSTNQYQELSCSQTSSAFLSVCSSGNIRRSSTSDIIEKKPSPTGGDSRRPSTSDMLRKARVRKGSENKIGRSVSQGGIARGAMRKRRTSMAY